MPSVNKCLNYYFVHYDNELQIFLGDNLIDTLDVSKKPNTDVLWTNMRS